MSAPRVCMFVHTALLHDARVEREAAALAAAGYDVRVVAARGAGTATRERRDGFRSAGASSFFKLEKSQRDTNLIEWLGQPPPQLWQSVQSAVRVE